MCGSPALACIHVQLIAFQARRTHPRGLPGRGTSSTCGLILTGSCWAPLLVGPPVLHAAILSRRVLEGYAPLHSSSLASASTASANSITVRNHS